MGYYTDYELTVYPSPEQGSVLDRDLKDGDTTGYGMDRYGKDGTYYGGEWKWYDHQEDMLNISERYPDYIFRLVGYGEERGDYWVKFFKAGNFYTQNLAIRIPDFDPSLLGTHEKVRG